MKHNSEKFSTLKFTPKSIDIKEVNEKVEESLKLFKSSKIFSLLEKVHFETEKSGKITSALEIRAHENDFDENLQGNGYWSLICNQQAAINNILKVLKKITKKREKLLFNEKAHIK